MKIPLSYIVRNLWTRRVTTLLTAGGMGLVVFVFAAVLMLDAGLRRTLVGTGSYDNALLMRQGSQTEIQSILYRDQASLVETMPEVARGASGDALVSREIVALIAIPKRGSDKPANVVVRGVSPTGVGLRPQVHLTRGRMFRPGTSEIVAGSGVVDGFEGVELGVPLRFAGREWAVVGTFEGGKSGFDSEVWGDVEQMVQAFRRQTFSSMLVRLRQRDEFAAFRDRIATDQRLTLEVKPEPVFYEDQSRSLSQFISILGVTLSAIFSIGAMIGAMITMYAAVANRTGEIGTLRALGFRRSSILAAFLAESVLLALLGGIVGLVLASFLQAFTVTTMNFQSFSQLAFGFDLTPRIVLVTLAFSVAMGVVGGFLPSVRAARLEIVDALRAA
ncbi:MAG TPA: ABC transporter permease [Usitatibacter sp.]|nr:ABC transporter permease [Usitatibacter sp.]